MAYDIWDSCLLLPGIGRIDCLAGIQAGASVLQFLGTIGAMALTLWIWRRSATSERRSACEMVRTYTALLDEVLRSLRDAAETQQVERLAAGLTELTEICQLGRDIRANLLPPLAVYEFFKLRAIAANAEQRARLHLENREIRTFTALRGDFERYRTDAKFTGDALARDMAAPPGAKRTTDPSLSGMQ